MQKATLFNICRHILQRVFFGTYSKFLDTEIFYAWKNNNNGGFKTSSLLYTLYIQATSALGCWLSVFRVLFLWTRFPACGLDGSGKMSQQKNEKSRLWVGCPNPRHRRKSRGSGNPRSPGIGDGVPRLLKIYLVELGNFFSKVSKECIYMYIST